MNAGGQQLEVADAALGDDDVDRFTVALAEDGVCPAIVCSSSKCGQPQGARQREEVTSRKSGPQLVQEFVMSQTT